MEVGEKKKWEDEGHYLLHGLVDKEKGEGAVRVDVLRTGWASDETGPFVLVLPRSPLRKWSKMLKKGGTLTGNPSGMLNPRSDAAHYW